MRRELPLTDRLTALREAVEAADGALPPEQVQPARDLLAKAGARVALGEATVVALAGATGSGKSTLFNALAGAELSPPGVRRPTTGTAHASVWGEAGSPALLDWLGVPRRHVQPDPDPALDELVLLDLPDHDSTAVQHRLEVDRLVQLVDVLVWVLDPQKYADAAVHDRYLAPQAGHAGVLVVVLSQVDRLDVAARQACLADLRALLAERVRDRRATSDRLAADARQVAAGLGGICGGSGGAVSGAERKRLVAALSDAAGVPVVGAAVERSVRSDAVGSTGWPPLRWVRKVRPDPLRRLHLSGSGDDRVRTSLAPSSGVQRAAVTDAVRDVRDAVGSDLPPAWRDNLREVLDDRERTLPDALDQAVAGTDLGVQKRARWWGAVGALQWLFLLVALVGAGWLLALVGLGLLQLDDVVPLPEVSGIPLPTLLLGVGLLAGLLLAVVVRPFVNAGARRRRRRAETRLRKRVEDVAETRVLAPAAEVLAARERFCAAVGRAGS